MLLKADKHYSFGGKALFFIIATLCACVLGVVAITNSPILIGMFIGLLFGLFFISKPRLTIWIVVVLGLLTPALFDMLGPGFSKLLWAFSLMALLLWVPGLFHLISFNPNKKQYVPLYIWVLLIFVVSAVMLTLLQSGSWGEAVAGFKRYFQTYGLIIALAALPLVYQDFDRLLKALFFIALLQLPFAIFERFILVPLRGGIAVGGGEATDVVAGTMGANLDGGSPNSVMVVILLTAFSFIFSRWKEKLFTTKHLLLSAVILFSPLALGETKVVLVLLPVVALVLIGKDLILSPVKYIPWFLGLLLLTFAFGYLYVHVILDSTFDEFVLGSLKYNTGDLGYGDLVLNRFTSLTFWLSNHGLDAPLDFLFGHGLGSSYGNGLNAGHVAQSYPGYGIALTTISSVLWDLGLIGLILYLAIFVLAWLEVNKLQAVTKSTKVRADCLGIKAGIVLTMSLLLYSNTQVNLLSHELIIAVLLGYAAFLLKTHNQLK